MENRSLFPNVFALDELADGQEADFFALLTQAEQLTTRDGKPYLRVGFKGARREVSFPVWSDSPWYQQALNEWRPGEFYKLRAAYHETDYGPQLEIGKIRAVRDEDRQSGFDPADFQPRSRFDTEEMFAQLVKLVEETIGEAKLRALVLHVLNTNRERLVRIPAATRNHHAFVGGWIEHVLSVTRTCIFLAEKYDRQYPDLRPPLDKDLVVAGGVLHDIGKLRELRESPGGADYTPAGNLVGHVLQGRDIVREAAAACPVEPETLLRLEHIVISHQRLAEWGSPKPPMTPEALLVHYADDIDAKFEMMYAALRDETGSGPMTSAKNPLRHKIYRGGSA